RSALNVASLDPLDPSRPGVGPGPAPPLAVAGMPGPAVLVHQLVDGRRRLTDQIVAADAIALEDIQRALQVTRGVVQHNELHTAVMAHRGMSRVEDRKSVV